MEQLTTYRVKGKEIGLEFLFKYDLNGVLKMFEIVNGTLGEKQINWLFRGYLPKDITTDLPFTTVKELNNYLLVRFPATESMFKGMWFNNKEMRSKFDIEQSPADLSFDAFWKAYDLKVNREKSQKAWEKLNEAAKIKCFLALKAYNKHLTDTKQAKAHLVTWLNQKRYNDEY